VRHYVAADQLVTIREGKPWNASRTEVVLLEKETPLRYQSAVLAAAETPNNGHGD
jgi:hypothetical protein